jgi:DNA invertase Pin-like site-specific DNA recombinase
MQLDALTTYGCERIFSEKKSGKNIERDELQNLLAIARKNDVIVVYKLDRLARSLRDLINLVNSFNEKGIGFVSLNDKIDTTTPQGRFMFHIFGAVAEFERDIIRERTKSGLISARARGKKGGRIAGLSPKAEKIAKHCAILYKQDVPISEILTIQKISRATLYKYLRLQGIEF